MIPRTLVPFGSRPPDADAVSQRRRPTTLDERTLIPAMLPIVPLNGRSNIPTNLPLESIAARVVVPRDLNREAFQVQEEVSAPVQPTELDERIAVPVGSVPPMSLSGPLVPPADLVDLDVFMTGEVNLLTKPKEDAAATRNLVTRISSVAFHVLLLSTLVLWARVFPPHPPTQQEIDLANRQLTWIPPESLYSVKPKPEPKPVQPPPRVHVDPRVLREVIPPVPQPAPRPEPERPKKDLPDAPMPKSEVAQLDPLPPAPKPDAPKPPLKLETPDTPQPRPGLVLPPNRSIEDSIRDAAKSPSGGGRSGAMIGPMPHTGGTPGGGAGQGQGTFGNGYQILTPTEGVDFSDYMQRVLENIRRNWYAVMPQSAMLGDRGRVMLKFRINSDGSVPNGDPEREMSSGKEPLDRAAISSIRSSNPFEPLPPAFHGPFIEIRIIYLYNLPLEAAYQ
jgi:TonB family protein